MDVELQCCTREQSVKLESLGIMANSIFWHVYPDMRGWRVLPDGMFNKRNDEIEYWPAYTPSELSKLLPSHIPNGANIVPFELTIRKGCDGIWSVGYESAGPMSIGFQSHTPEYGADTKFGANFAKVLTDQLISLLETGRITAQECNERFIS